jgi:oxalyl-CoA decarboxylase
MTMTTPPAVATEPSPADAVDHAIGLLARAERPLIVLGKGAASAEAGDQIRAFVEATGIPYLPMSMAKGPLPDDHPQSAAAARSLALARADVVMLVGARLSWLVGQGEAPGWSSGAVFIKADVGAAGVDSSQPIAAPLAGDIGRLMTALADRATPGQIAAPAAWRAELDAS